jgi:uncharacterized membrane protein
METQEVFTMALRKLYQSADVVQYSSVTMRRLFSYVSTWLTAVVALTTIIGCAGVPQPVQLSPPDDTVDQAVMSSEQGLSWLDVQPIIQKRCTPCHVPGGYMYGVVPLDTYEKVGLKAPRIVKLVLELRTMPFQREMPDDERELLAQWIDAGMPH